MKAVSSSLSMGGERRFGLKAAANDSVGEIKKTGVYLKDDGASGIVQQIDLSI